MIVETIVVLLVMCVCCTFISTYIAKRKGRSAWEGALLGAFLGILGLVIEAIMPDQKTR
jgi:hypothetical protein